MAAPLPYISFTGTAREALLGTAEPAILHEWFDKLCIDGSAIEPLTPKPWGASDGQVTDRHGLRWLIGYEPQA